MLTSEFLEGCFTQIKPVDCVAQGGGSGFKNFVVIGELDRKPGSGM